MDLVQVHAKISCKRVVSIKTRVDNLFSSSSTVAVSSNAQNPNSSIILRHPLLAVRNTPPLA